MDLTELRDAFTQLIDQGHGKEKLWDDDNPTFAVIGIITKDLIDENGDEIKRFYFDIDEVK